MEYSPIETLLTCLLFVFKKCRVSFRNGNRSGELAVQLFVSGSTGRRVPLAYIWRLLLLQRNNYFFCCPPPFTHGDAISAVPSFERLILLRDLNSTCSPNSIWSRLTRPRLEQWSVGVVSACCTVVDVVGPVLSFSDSFRCFR